MLERRRDFAQSWHKPGGHMQIVKLMLAAMLAGLMCLAPAAQAQSREAQFQEARRQAALVSQAAFIGKSDRELFPTAKAVLDALLGFGARGNDEAVAVARYVVGGYLANEDYTNAEVVARWRVEQIPGVTERLRNSSRPMEVEQLLSAETMLWEAELDLGHALAGQKKWREALPHQRAALEHFLGTPNGTYYYPPTNPTAIMLRMLLADVLAQTRDPALVPEATRARIEEIRQRTAAGKGCEDETWDALALLVELPRNASVEPERAATFRDRIAACPNFAARINRDR